MVEDEGDEEGDHGSIVAFRIPCRPSVDFQPPSSCRYPPDSPCRLLQPADLLHPLATRLLLSCLFGPSLRSCPPAASRSPLSLGRPYPPLLPPPPTPAPSHATRTKPSTLDRRRVLAPSTCTRRYAGPDPPTRHQTLFPPRSHVAPHPPSFHPFHPLVLGFVPVSVSLPRLRASHIFVLAFRLSPSVTRWLSASLSLVATPAVASEGEAHAARSRSVA